MARIHDYRKTWPPKFHDVPREDARRNYLHMGVELEVELAGVNDRRSRLGLPRFATPAILDHCNISRSGWRCKRDGSLGRHGVELVSNPHTLDAYRNAAAGGLWRVLDRIAYEGGRSYETDTCGLHIHADRAYIAHHQIDLRWAVRRYDDYIFKFSRRNRDQFDKWCAGGYNPDFKYMAVNFCPRRTVEFRLFRGTLHVPAIMRALEFVVGFLKLAQLGGPTGDTLPPESQFAQIFDTCGLKHLAEWCHERYNTSEPMIPELIAAGAAEK